MTELTIQLTDKKYKSLKESSEQCGKTISSFISELIGQKHHVEKKIDITKDPIFQMEGYESKKAPRDLSLNIDDYLYGKKLI